MKFKELKIGERFWFPSLYGATGDRGPFIRSGSMTFTDDPPRRAKVRRITVSSPRNTTYRVNSENATVRT